MLVVFVFKCVMIRLFVWHASTIVFFFIRLSIASIFVIVFYLFLFLYICEDVFVENIGALFSEAGVA